MVGRLVVRATIALVAVSFAMPLTAGDIGDFLATIPQDFHRRNCWPAPFVQADRAQQRQPFCVEIAAGWERQNQLSEFHFLPGGKELTEAGRMRVQWIQTEAPEAYRQIFVHRADSPQETAVRMQTVQRFVAQSQYAGNVPVIESTRTDEGWPADRIDLVSKKAVGAIMDPKLMGAASTGVAGH